MHDKFQPRLTTCSSCYTNGHLGFNLSPGQSIVCLVQSKCDCRLVFQFSSMLFLQKPVLSSPFDFVLIQILRADDELMDGLCWRITGWKESFKVGMILTDDSPMVFTVYCSVSAGVTVGVTIWEVGSHMICWAENWMPCSSKMSYGKQEI